MFNVRPNDSLQPGRVEVSHYSNKSSNLNDPTRSSVTLEPSDELRREAADKLLKITVEK